MEPAKLESILTVHPAERPYEYRSRVQVRGNAKGLGFFEPATHKLTITEHCPVADPAIQKYWANFLVQKDLAKLSTSQDQFKVEWTLLENGQVMESINRPHAFLGFTQINHDQNKVLRNIVAGAVGDKSGSFLLDLYGGNGNLSKELTSKYSKVVCVDSHNQGPHFKDSTAWADKSEGFMLVRSDIENFFNLKHWESIEGPDCIIADPPRTGLGDKVVDRFLDLRSEKLVLVSCDPITLGRDLRRLSSGYELTALHLVDMFPQTYHIEAVAVLAARAQ
jgi:tRNA/tmRNA/rRNA uracil-C5-methylase (TrmA/RlmC/RlmD family)